MDWLSRYQRGDRDSVWHELRQLGAVTGDRAAEAQAICDEMARRARQNVEELVRRLAEDGYRFHSNDDARTAVQPHFPPSEQAGLFVEWLQERFGAVPMTVSSWIRHVGDVWLVGTHPEWDSSSAADPLVVEIEGLRFPDSPIQAYYEDCLESWEESREDGDEVGLFTLPISPDRHHKNNVSGGPPYGVVLPDGCANAQFIGETTMPFVAYLNHAFRSGGFPGRVDDVRAWRVRRRLSENLLPL